MLSIPRDLYVYLPGYSMQRINTAFSLGETIGYPGGGPGLLADTIRYNLGIQIDHFARVEHMDMIADIQHQADVMLDQQNTAFHFRDNAADQLRQAGANLIGVALKGRKEIFVCLVRKTQVMYSDSSYGFVRKSFIALSKMICSMIPFGRHGKFVTGI